MNENIEFLEIITTFKNKRLLIIGDIIVDRYIRGKVTKIAPDAPVPFLTQSSSENFLGGALNLARCISNMNGQIHICGAVGEDDEGKFVLEACSKSKTMDNEGIFTISNVPTTLTTRVMGNNQHLLRIERTIPKSAVHEIREEVKTFLLDHRHNYDAVIIADFDIGFITPEIVETVVETFGSNIPIVVRPILEHFSYYNDVTTIIVNRETAESLLQIPMINETSIRNSGLRILRMLNPQSVLITSLEDGFHLFRHNGEVSHLPSSIKEIIFRLGYRDLTYNDTITSLFALGLAITGEMTTSSKLALKVAEYYISRADSLPLTYDELLRYLKTQN